jgi:hypothetical protein
MKTRYPDIFSAIATAFVFPDYIFRFRPEVVTETMPTVFISFSAPAHNTVC